MVTTVATLQAKLTAETRDFSRGMKSVTRDLNSVRKTTKQTSLGVDLLKTSLKALGGVFAARKIKDFVVDSTRMAVAAEEAAAAFNTTFGPSVARVAAFVEEFANKAGFAEFELEQMLATTGAVVQGLGATEEQSADLSTSMATLAGDVASFSNASGGAKAVLKALQSAINGEREALKTYGLAISEAEVQQIALNETGKASVKELTRLEKATATVTLAYQKAGKMVGDLDRTQDSAANTMRRVSAQFKELQVEIGTKLIPTLSKMLKVAEVAIDVLGDLGLGAGNTAELIDLFAANTNDAEKAVQSMADENRDFQRLLDRSGVSVSELAAIIRDGGRDSSLWQTELRRLSQTLGLTGIESRLLDKAITELSEAYKVSTRESEANAEAAGEAARDYVVWATSADGARAALEGVTVATEDQTKAMRAAVDPAFKLFDEMQNLASALNEVTRLEEEGKRGTVEFKDAMLDLLKTQADVNGAVAGFEGDASGMLRALVDLGREAGVSEADVRSLFSELLLFAEQGQVIGEGIRDGIVSGITGLRQLLADKLGSNIGGAIEAIKGELLIASPSRLFAKEVGRPIAEGIAAGIDSGLVAIEASQLRLDRALQAMADAANEDVSDLEFRGLKLAIDQAKLALLDTIQSVEDDALRELARVQQAVLLSVTGPLRDEFRIRAAEIQLGAATQQLGQVRLDPTSTALDIARAELAVDQAALALFEAQVAQSGFAGTAAQAAAAIALLAGAPQTSLPGGFSGAFSGFQPVAPAPRSGIAPVTVIVEGSVVSENELIDAVTAGLARSASRN